MNILKKYFTRKKSKPHPNFISISNLSSRISIEDLSIKIGQSNQFNLNKFKKILNQKLFGSPLSSTSSSMIKSSASSQSNIEVPLASLGPSASTRFFESSVSNPEKSEDSLYDLEKPASLSSETSVNQALFGVLVDLGVNSKSSSDVSDNKTAQVNASSTPSIMVRESAESTKYVPLLSLKQYESREAKLKDVQKKIIKDSSTEFFFI